MFFKFYFNRFKNFTENFFIVHAVAAEVELFAAVLQPFVDYIFVPVASFVVVLRSFLDDVVLPIAPRAFEIPQSVAGLLS